MSRGLGSAEASRARRANSRGGRGTPLFHQETPIPVTVSLGISRAPDPALGSTADFISRADEAMYAAKRSGRNRVSVAGDLAVRRTGPIGGREDLTVRRTGPGWRSRGPNR